MSIKEALTEITKSNDKFRFFLEHILSGEATDTEITEALVALNEYGICLLYTSPSPRDKRQSRMPSSA